MHAITGRGPFLRWHDVRLATLGLAFALALVPSSSSAQAGDFTLIPLPDTQFYTCDTGSASCANGLGIFASQTNWIEANRDALDIRFVTLLGDCAQNGNLESEYDIADAAFQTIEADTSVEHPDGIPYGIAVGNHDQFPNNDPGSIPSVSDVNDPAQATTTTTYNSYFGEDRFCPGSICRSYYGDHFGINNDNHYDLFSANGYDFVVVHIEYMSADTPLRQAVIAWADGVLSTFSDRRAIVVTHNAIGTGNPATFSNQGAALYEGLRGNPNFFLMLGGHVNGEGQRSDTFNGNTVHTLLSDYQGRSNGGDGWLRIMTFRPALNQIAVQTYSPFLDSFETDANSQFTISYDMSSGFPAAETATGMFQEGSDGYASTVDTYIRVNTGAHGGEDHLFWDGSPLKYALLRFENLFDTNGGQIPAGATITSAVLDYVADDNGNTADVHAVTHDWTDTVEYTSFGATPGAQAGEDYDASSIDQASGAAPGGARTEHAVNVTAAVAAWSADPSTNYGLIVVPTGNSGTGIRSSEYAVVADRPKLTVTYLASTCVVDTDCDDMSVCTTDSCLAGVCQNVAIGGCCQSDGECGDANECTVDSCDLGTHTCGSVPSSPGSACGDSTSNDCNSPDSCDGAGTCLDNLAIEGSGCGDPTDTECNDPDTCDGVGSCQANLAIVGAMCGSAGTTCTGADSCDMSGNCATGLPADCDDSDICTADACDEIAGCTHTEIPECVPLPDTAILHFDFNETGNAPGSTGTDSMPIKLFGDTGGADDYHSEDGAGVSGQLGDRSFANTGPSDQGRLASAGTNGFRAEQVDNPAIDGLTAMTISGWFKTELDDTFLPNATPRLANNHAGAAGFNLQFLSGFEGDLKLEVDNDSIGANSTGDRYSAKQTWVFFAVSYDGTTETDNVNFYVGFRNDTEAGGGAGSAAVQLVNTASLDRGSIGDENVGLHLANRSGNDRPFKGFLDEFRIDNVAYAGTEGLAVLENYRQAALVSPLAVSLVSVSESALDSGAAGAQELSGVSYDPDTDRFWTISDDGGILQEVDVDLDASGSILNSVTGSSVVLAPVRDYEGIAYTNSARNSVFVSEEGTPGIHEYDRTSGASLQSLTVPSVFTDNLVPNRGFESLTRSSDGSEMLTGSEQALSVDGPLGTSTTEGTVSRWLRYALSENVATLAEQYAYVVEPAHDTAGGGDDGSSLSEIVSLPNGQFLAMERSEAAGEILVRVFLTSMEDATDVSQGDLASGLIGESYTPATKKLLFSDDRLGKTEGLALGPVLENGDLVLLSVEDVASTNSTIRSFVLSGVEVGECGDGNVDAGEQCDVGSFVSGDCCSDTCEFESMATECRSATDVCDVAESCTGSGAACPTDGFASPATECRSATDVCDVAESCTGSGAACPTDGFASPATECRSATDVCDVAESCTGSGAACPTDLLLDGVPCLDGDTCNGAEQCVVGVCEPAAPLDCDDSNECTADACDEISGCSNTPISECAVGVPAASRWGDALIVVLFLATTIVAFRRRNLTLTR